MSKAVLDPEIDAMLVLEQEAGSASVRKLAGRIARLKEEYIEIRNELEARRNEATEYQKNIEGIARNNVKIKLKTAIKKHITIDEGVLDMILRDVLHF